MREREKERERENERDRQPDKEEEGVKARNKGIERLVKKTQHRKMEEKSKR